MPPPRILMLIFAGAAVVLVACRLIGFDGWVADTAGVTALLTAAVQLVRVVLGPVARWALAGGVVILAAASVVAWLVIDGWPAGPVTGATVMSSARQQVTADQVAMVFLLIAAAVLLVGVVALPRLRRAGWLTVLACVVALGPVAYAAKSAADTRDLSYSESVPAALLWHLAPGLAATVLAGLVLVLAVSRAGRWLLLPAGVLLVQVTTALWTSGSAAWWTLAGMLGGGGTSSSFLSPGLSTDVSASAPTGFTLELEFGAALAAAALVLGPALIAAGVARRPAGSDEPEQPQEA